MNYFKWGGRRRCEKNRNLSCYNASYAPTVLDWSLPGVLIDEGEHSLLCRPLLLVDGCGGGVGQEVAGRLALALQHRPVQNWLWWSIQHQTINVFTVAVWRTRKKSFSQIQILNFCYTSRSAPCLMERTKSNNNSFSAKKFTSYNFGWLG